MRRRRPANAHYCRKRVSGFGQCNANLVKHTNATERGGSSMPPATLPRIPATEIASRKRGSASCTSTMSGSSTPFRRTRVEKGSICPSALGGERIQATYSSVRCAGPGNVARTLVAFSKFMRRNCTASPAAHSVSAYFDGAGKVLPRKEHAARRRESDEGLAQMGRRRQEGKQKEGVVAAFRRGAYHSYNCMMIRREKLLL